MQVEDWSEIVPAVSLGIGLAACAGLRAWLPLLLTGLLARLNVIELGSSFHFLASNRALVLFGIASLVEIVGDKIPAVDHALDMVSTVLRPLAGALLAASVIGPFTDPLTSVVLGLVVGTPSALLPHALKSVARAASTAFTAGVANPLLSLLEDAMTVALFFLAVLVPLAVALLVVVATLALVRRRRRVPARPAPLC